MEDGKLNEPAYPIKGGIHEHQFLGASLRDYFAASAAPALLNLCRGDSRDEGVSLIQHVAACAYDFADAMLEARQGT